jgi:predicted permease
MATDLRYTLRTLRNNPGFAAVSIATLALGIGANTTVFSVMNSTLGKPLPFPDPGRLVLVWRSNIHELSDRNIVDAPDYLDWQRQNHVFESMAIFNPASYNLSGDKQPELVPGARVSANFFRVLGVKPYLGRAFAPEEEIQGKDREVVLSYGLWTRRYGADQSLVGRTVRVGGESYMVVGVMPRDFEFQFGASSQLWVPVGYTHADHERGSHSFMVCARLKRGVTLAQAGAEMDTIGRGLAQQYPQDDADETATVTRMDAFGVENLKPMLLALLAAVGFVLLIACVNVANLMMARGAAREKELAIRRALGAGRLRVVRQLLTESVLLAVLGGASGLLVAAWSIALLPHVVPSHVLAMPFRRSGGIEMDGRVFVFTLLVACLTGILFGLAPAFSAARSDSNISEPLKEGSRGSSGGEGRRLRNILVASEVALALMVLCGSGLLIESMVRVLGVSSGLNARNVLTMSMSLPQVNLYVGPPVHARFCQDLDEHVGALPGVLGVGSTAQLPLGGGNASRGFFVEGRPDPGVVNQAGASYSVACPGYFHTMGIPLLEGREFTHQDTDGAPPVIVINQTMAHKYWDKQDPIGRRIKLGLANSEAPWMTVVGVTGDVRQWGLDDRVYPEFFRPYTQAAWPFMTVVVRTVSAPGAFIDPVKKAIAAFDPDQPVSSGETMEEVVHNSMGSRRFPMLLLSAFAVLALVLAAVGISGVVSYAAAQRTREIGIRVALGASKVDVLRLVVTQSMLWAAAGTALGIVGSLGVMRLLSGMLYGVQPADPMVLAAVSALLMGVALLACYIPARRAARVDPMTALRYQ